MSVKIGAGVVLTALLFLAIPAEGVVAGDSSMGGRWYSQGQVDRGKTVFERYCRECHGEEGRSVPNWNRQGEDGLFPPPPLNGTAHTWHHDLELLRRIIREGGVNSGGRMPSFAQLLDAGDIDAVIAAFQSNWPDEIYDRWSGANIERYPIPPIIREILGEEG